MDSPVGRDRPQVEGPHLGTRRECWPRGKASSSPSLAWQQAGRPSEGVPPAREPRGRLAPLHLRGEGSPPHRQGGTVPGPTDDAGTCAWSQWSSWGRGGLHGGFVPTADSCVGRPLSGVTGGGSSCRSPASAAVLASCLWPRVRVLCSPPSLGCWGAQGGVRMRGHAHSREPVVAGPVLVLVSKGSW